MKRVAAVLAGLVVLLAGCKDPHKGQHCVHSHSETYYISNCIVYSNNGLCQVSIPMPYTHNVCDTWADNTPAAVKP